jgi:hypothetical protein
VNATTLDLTNLEVTNIKAKDGTAALTLADSTGVATLSANPVLNAGTANGVPYLNASKVLTTGSALTFDGTKLGVNGGLIADNNLVAQVNSPTSSAKFIGFNRNGDYGLIIGYDLSGVDCASIRTVFDYPIAFSVNNSEQMRLTSTGLGIGTSSPSNKLTINASGAAGILVRSADTNFSSINIGVDPSNFTYIDSAKNGTGTARPLAFFIDGSEKMRLDSSGNLGIGTSSPISKLHVNGDIRTDGDFDLIGGAGTPEIRFYQNSGNWAIQNSAGSLILRDMDASADRAVLDGSGNLGLGVTPSAWGGYTGLQVKATVVGGIGTSDNALFGSNVFYDGSNFKYINTTTATLYRQLAASHAWYTAPSGTAGNAITFTQAMTLDASGRLGVGTTSPDSKLHVEGTGGIRLGFGGASVNYYNADTHLFFNGALNTEQMRLTSTGLGIGTTSPLASLHITKNASGAVGPEIRLNNDSGNFLDAGLISFYGGTFPRASIQMQVSSASAGGRIVFSTGFNPILERMTLDASGNLGLGVTPSAWSGISGSAFEIKGNAYIASTTQVLSLATNCFFNGTNWIYKSTNPANRYDTFAGQHLWYTAPSGTAGNAITFVQAMTLDASGRLGVGTTTTANGRITATGGDANLELTYLSTSAVGTTANYNRWVNTGGSLYIGVESSTGGRIISPSSSYAAAISTSNATPLVLGTNNAERARITSGGDFQTSSGGSFQVGGTAARATTAGTNRIDIFDGTAPVGTLANGVSFYSASGEANVMDAAGNATLLSPHDSETNEWIFRSKHTPTGKVLRIDVERLLRFVNDHFGLDAVKEFVEE